MGHVSYQDNSMPDRGSSEGALDPMDFANPVSAYFFLSDDAQDEVCESDKKSMKCISCGHRFLGEFYDSRPECFSSNTKEVIDENDNGHRREQLKLN